MSPDLAVLSENGQAPRSTSLWKEMAMTILYSNSSYPATPATIRRAFGVFLARLARLINGWIAAVIAHREHQANLVVLRHLSDRELKDIGLLRGEIGEPLAEAAKAQLRMQSRPSGPEATRAVGD
jgi:uncharacterized protein YjiS (DUF1127 family)